MATNIEPEDWRSLCRTTFGATLSGSKREQLFADIAAVLLGVKPALLVDCGKTTTKKFQDLLASILKKLNMDAKLTRNCFVAGIYEDVFFVNTSALWSTSKHTQISEDSGGEMTYSPVDVNIEQGYNSPHVVLPHSMDHTVIEGMCSKICDTFETVDCLGETGDTSDCYTTVIDLDSVIGDFNLCTVFGTLLGYPVIYWFSPSKGYTLDMVPLVQYTIKAKIDREQVCSQWIQNCFCQERVIYSFTVPASLLPKVKGVIDSWTQRISSVAWKQGLQLNVQTQSICLPHVAL